MSVVEDIQTSMSPEAPANRSGVSGRGKTSPPVTDPNPRQGCPNWAKFLMISSLTINLVVVGLILGQRLQDSGSAGRDWVMYLVPEAKYDVAQEVLEKRRPQIIALRQEQQTKRMQMVDVVRAEEFMSAELQQLLEDDRNLATERRTLMHDQMVEVMSLLDADERQMAADGMQRWVQNRGGGRPR